MVVALDPGFGFVKVYTEKGGCVLQSSVAVPTGPRIGRMAGLRAAKPPLEVTTANGVFYVGEGAHDWGTPIENLDFDRLTGSPEMRALLYAALALAGVEGETKIIVGLPLEVASDPDVKRGVREFLVGDHSWALDGKSFALRITQLILTGQPVGALFDYFLDESGQVIKERLGEFDREIGILNIGKNTVDLLGVRSGEAISRLTRGEKLGVRRLLELVNHGKLYTLSELDERLRAGQLDISGALPIWQSEVVGFIEAHWGKLTARFARIIAVGGGILLLGNYLSRRFPNLWIPDEPLLSQARGLYKYALSKERKTAEARS
jgi:hypothetical protein